MAENENGQKPGKESTMDIVEKFQRETSVSLDEKNHIGEESNTQLLHCNECNVVAQIGDSNTSIQTGKYSVQAHVGALTKQEQRGQSSQQALFDRSHYGVDPIRQHQLGDSSKQALFKYYEGRATQTQIGSKCFQSAFGEAVTQYQEGDSDAQIVVSPEHSYQAQKGDHAMQIVKGFTPYMRQDGNHCLQLAIAGCNAKMQQTGDYGIQLADNCDTIHDGDYGVLIGLRHCYLESTGQGSILFGLGPESKLKAGLGSYLIFGVWDDDYPFYKADRSKLRGIRVYRVDGKRVKPNVLYKLKHGKLQRC